MPKKVLITLSLVGATLGNTDFVQTALAEENNTSTLLQHAKIKQATTTENLNLRDQANTNGKILTTIPKGKTVTLLSEKDSNGWYKVSYDGKTGYVSSSYVTGITNDSSNTVTTKQAITTENLNLRDQASTRGKILTTIPKGKTVTLLSEKDSNGWYKVSYDGKTGYVTGSYVTGTTNDSSNTVTTKQAMTTENLNLRDQASVSGKILTTIPRGKTITLLSGKDLTGWYKVSYDGKTGYASGTYILELDNSSSDSNNPSTSLKPIEGQPTDNLNLRDAANMYGKILTTIPKGYTVQVLADKDENGWYKVTYKGHTGYVNGSYFKVTKSEELQEAVLWTGKTTTLLNVRNAPSVSGSHLGTLAKGTSVEVIKEESNDWLKIKYQTGYGYVSGDYIQKDSISTPETPETIKKVGYVYNLDLGLLNVRPQPNTSQASIGKLSEGDRVIVVGESGNWYEIEYNNSTAYVSKGYITFTDLNNHPDANINFETSPRLGVVIDNVPRLNIRKSPTTNSTIVGTLTSKDEISIIGFENDFYEISYNGADAYVYKDYVGIKATSTLNGRVSYLTTKYNYSLSEFAKVQQNYTSGTLNSIITYLDPSNSINIAELLQYLRIDQFRSFDVEQLNQELENKGMLHNQAQIFYNASRYYNIDPIFLVAQSIHETNWGTSSLAKGITITEIADENKPIKNSKGIIIDYERIPLDKPVTVYNLFGIGARDHAPRLLGTTYAYKKDWTTPEKAIFGAAEFISLNYINSAKYQQNTPFKIKYNHLSTNQWHQYATTPWYAYEIGKYMQQFSDLYDEGQEFLLDIATYK